MKNKKIALIITLVSVLVIAISVGAFVAFAEEDLISVRGDVNGDGLVNSEDVALLSQYFASYDYDQSKADVTVYSGADLNGDDKISLADLLVLRREFNLYYAVPQGNNGDTIADANNLWGGVNAYYQDGARKDFTIENNHMSFNMHTEIGNTIVSSITNSNGVPYVQNTMDVFVKMNDGNTYYSKTSMNATSYDLYRFGMYYYELRAENAKLSFVDKMTETASLDLKVHEANYVSSMPSLGSMRPTEMTEPENVTYGNETAHRTSITGLTDPKIYYSNVTFSADTYKYIVLDMKVDPVDSASSMCSLEARAFNSSNAVMGYAFQAIIADGEWHTYYFKLDNPSTEASADYTGTVKEYRFDFVGQIGDTFEYKNVRAATVTPNGPVDLSMCRYLHVYSDKAQQVIQVSAQKDTTGIEEIGVVTNINADTVNKIIVKDTSGTHYSLEGVDWNTVEYVGFDIKDAGIFGYIMLPETDKVNTIARSGRTELTDTSSGKIRVTVEDGQYVIVQSKTPANGTINAASTDSNDPNYDNKNDFFMGHRIYTDDGHDFAAFIAAAEVERNPLAASNIEVDAASTGASYLGYDVLRGTYMFNIDGSNFSTPYYEEQNKHFNVKFTVTGDSYARNMYIMTSTSHGELQSAAVLDENNLLLPINVQVGKNFSDGGTSVFDKRDEPWSEAYFPMSVKAGEEKTYNFLNLYMNWGKFPLKQVSSIQLAPLYHLSTGVTETNCVLPWYSNMGYARTLLTMPDHRSMSAPLWSDQPNHTSGGDHRFLQYTDAEGNYSASEVQKNYITSYGPTYAEIVFEHTSDDGRIKTKYTHMEMPQTDENRAYYTMEYEILKDITFEDFKRDFAFYSMNAYAGVEYQSVGYLNEDNECVVIDAIAGTEYYTLGTNAPYFSFFRDDEFSKVGDGVDRGYVNLSFLIKDAEFNLANVNSDPNFVVKTDNRTLYLTLNLENVTLKKGDTIKINSIIMPWGWGGNLTAQGNMKTAYEYDYDTYQDKNVRDVRENTCLNPLRAEAGEGTVVVPTNWLPEVQLTNGEEGIFTLKGASNNSTVKISGVTKLCVPMVYQKIDGEWVRYNLSSQHSPDSKRYGQAYDGYAVQYNKDGTYTYSFVTDMTGGAEKEFKVVFSDDFVEEPRYGAVNPDEDLAPTITLDADKIATLVNGTATLGGAVVSNDGSYVTVTNQQGTDNAFFYPIEGGSAVSGQYMMITYRSTNADTWEWYLRTKGQDNGHFNLEPINDGRWHTVIVDLSQTPSGRYVSDSYGRYHANMVRWAIMRTSRDYDISIDVKAIAFSDHIEDLVAYSGVGENGYVYYGSIKNFVAQMDLTNHTHTWDDEDADTKTCIVCGAKECQPGAHVVVETTSNNGTTMTVTGTCSNCKEEQYRYNHTFGETRPLRFLTASQIVGKSNSTIGGIQLSDDGTYATVSNKLSSGDGYIFLLDGNVNAGQYVMIKYKTTNGDTWQWGIKSKDQSYGWFFQKPINNGEWQTIILDLSQSPGGTYVADETNGKYYASAIRWDLMNTSSATEKTIDIAFIATGDNLDSLLAINNTTAYTYYDHFSGVYATASEDHTHIYTEATCETPATCMLCSATKGEALGHDWGEVVNGVQSCTRCDAKKCQPGAHVITETTSNNGTTMTVTGTCSNCKEQVYKYNHTFGATRPLYFLTASQIATNANKVSTLGGVELSGDGTYTTITNKQGTSNAFFFLINDNSKTVTGQYMMIKYRSTNADKWEWYTNSKDGGSMTHFYVNPLNTGEWQTIIVDLSQVPSGAFVADSNGDYYAKNVRWAIMRYSKDYDISVDIQFVAFSDDIAELTAIGGTEGYVNYVNFDGARLAQVDANNHNHVWSEATCEAPATCMLCSATVGDALGHAYDNGTVTTEPTCTTAGVRTYVCSKDASHTYTESIDALGHDYIVNDEGIHICSRCDEERAVRVTISSIGGKSQFTSSQKFSVSVGKTTSTTSGKQGMLYLNGSGALCGEATGIKYRVLTSDGAQVIQEWRELEHWDDKTLWSENADYLAVQQGINDTITNAYNFIGKIDLSAFPGATVTVEVAFVLKDAPEGEDLLIFAHATDITNRETRSAYFNMSSIGGTAVGGFTQPSVFDENHTKYPAAGYIATSTSTLGHLYIFGWGGTQGTAKGVVYRVVDANGQALTDWQNLVQYGELAIFSQVTNTESTEYKNVTGAIPGASVYYFRGYADLTAFMDQKVNVEVAFVLDNLLENDETFTFITAENVKYVRPVRFQVGEVGKESATQLVNGVPAVFDTALHTSGSAKGKVYFRGYGGTIGNVVGVQFRVRSNSTGQVIQDWKDFDQYQGNPTLKEYQEQLSFVQSAIPGATKCYFVRGYMDISAFYGQTVTIEIAFVLEDQTHFIFVTETNCTNTEERPFLFNLSYPSVAAGGYTGATVIEKDFTTSTTSGKEGYLYYQGWVATYGEATHIEFRVLDTDGNQIQDWSTPDVYVNSGGAELSFQASTDAGVLNSVSNNLAGANAYNFWGYANLRAFGGQQVIVEYALVLTTGERATFYTAKTVTVNYSAS